MKLLIAKPDSNSVANLLQAWRFWVAGAFAGAVLGAALFYISPPAFRARATVNVDFHTELSLPQSTDRQAFYYLERETRKFEEVAFSDAVLAEVASATGAKVTELRSGTLQLSQPGNGGWHFYASDARSGQAVRLASAWADAFAQAVRAGLGTANSDPEHVITLEVSQTQDLVALRAPGLSVYMSSASIIFLAISGVLVLFFKRAP